MYKTILNFNAHLSSWQNLFFLWNLQNERTVSNAIFDMFDNLFLKQRKNWYHVFFLPNSQGFSFSFLYFLFLFFCSSLDAIYEEKCWKYFSFACKKKLGEFFLSGIWKAWEVKDLCQLSFFRFPFGRCIQAKCQK